MSLLVTYLYIWLNMQTSEYAHAGWHWFTLPWQTGLELCKPCLELMSWTLKTGDL